MKENETKSYRLTALTLRQIDELTNATGHSKANVIAVAIDRMHQQEIKTMSKFNLSMWMTTQLIAAARRTLESYLDSDNRDERAAAEEGIGCLKEAQPQYLMNLLPQNHPDRIAAFRILSEYTPFVDTPRAL